MKKLSALALVIILCAESFAAVVSDNDGSAFVTKAEFEAMKKDFAKQVDNYNDSIDAKIDGAIASYLAGFKVANKYSLVSILNNINSKGFNYNNAAGFPFTNGNITITCDEQEPEVWINGTFTYQNLTETGDWSAGLSHHAGAGRGNYSPSGKGGKGTAWRLVPMYGGNCLESYMNLREKLTFSIADSPAYHAANCYALAHTWGVNSNHYLNRDTNLNTETIQTGGDSGGKWLRKTSVSGTSYADLSGLSSGRGITTLSKSIVNTINNKTKGWAAPIAAISTTATGQAYSSEVDLSTTLTKTNPFGGTKTDSEKVTFNTGLFWNCTNSSCPWDNGADRWNLRPVTEGAYEYLYWHRQYVNTTAFDLTSVCVYAATLAFGEPVKYYHGLPICKNDYSAGTLTFSLQPVSVGTTATTRVGLCFRTQPFANMTPASDTANNMKDIKYKQRGTSTWQDCNSAGGIDDLAPGTTYDFMIENFPADAVLWVKPYRVQRGTSSTQVYAYLKTIGNIIMEVG